MLVHAAGESSTGNLPSGTYAIALQARDELHLLEVAQLLFRNNVKYKLIRETDPPYGGQAMAIGVFPREREEVRKLLSQLPLVR